MENERDRVAERLKRREVKDPEPPKAGDPVAERLKRRDTTHSQGDDR